MPSPPSSPNQYIRATDAAHAAYKRAAAAQGLDKQLHALIEAAWWVSAANDYLRKSYPEEYESVRDASGAGRKVAGLYWARSAAIHDPYALATVATPEDVISNVVTDLYDVYVWVRRDEMELFATGRSKTNFGKDDYDNHLAGKVVIDTIRDAIEWLRELRTEDLTPIDETE